MSRIADGRIPDIFVSEGKALPSGEQNNREANNWHYWL
jgi:hypothetical protein